MKKLLFILSVLILACNNSKSDRDTLYHLEANKAAAELIARGFPRDKIIIMLPYDRHVSRTIKRASKIINGFDSMFAMGSGRNLRKHIDSSENIRASVIAEIALWEDSVNKAESKTIQNRKRTEESIEKIFRRLIDTITPFGNSYTLEGVAYGVYPARIDTTIPFRNSYNLGYPLSSDTANAILKNIQY